MTQEDPDRRDIASDGQMSQAGHDFEREAVFKVEIEARRQSDCRS